VLERPVATWRAEQAKEQARVLQREACAPWLTCTLQYDNSRGLVYDAPQKFRNSSRNPLRNGSAAEVIGVETEGSSALGHPY